MQANVLIAHGLSSRYRISGFVVALIDQKRLSKPSYYVVMICSSVTI